MASSSAQIDGVLDAGGVLWGGNPDGNNEVSLYDTDEGGDLLACR